MAAPQARSVPQLAELAVLMDQTLAKISGKSTLAHDDGDVDDADVHCDVGQVRDPQLARPVDGEPPCPIRKIGRSWSLSVV